MKTGFIVVLMHVLILLGISGAAYGGSGRVLSSGKLIKMELDAEYSMGLTRRTGNSLGIYDLIYGYGRSDRNVEYGPFNRGLPFSTGFLRNQKDSKDKMRETGMYTLDGTVHEHTGISDQLNKIDFGEIGPHLGVGWDHEVGEAKKWVISFDLGVAYVRYSQS